MMNKPFDYKLFKYLKSNLLKHDIHIENADWVKEIKISSKKYDFYYYFDYEDFNTTHIISCIKEDRYTDSKRDISERFSDLFWEGMSTVESLIRSYKIHNILDDDHIR
jgi:hypothetical protein